MTQDSVSELERQLRQDAERVLDTQKQSTPVAALLERHSERQLQGKLVRSAGVAILAATIPAAWVASLLLQSPTNGTVGIGETAQPSSEQLVVEALPSHQPIEPNREVDPSTSLRDSTQPFPIVLVRTNEAGEQVFVHGLYVPERSESIDLSQLSQVQQRAVRAVLGMAKPPEIQRPF